MEMEIRDDLTSRLFGKTDGLELSALVQRSPSNGAAGGGLGVRKVCQYFFQKNDIAWICRTCQSDETCVLCNACFQDSQHEGHEILWYHSFSGGCCDCGDACAWKPDGFCSKHGKDLPDPESLVPEDVGERGRSLFAELAENVCSFCTNAPLTFETFEESVDDKSRVAVVYKDDIHTQHEVEEDLVALQMHSQFQVLTMKEELFKEGKATLVTSNSSIDINLAVAILREKGYRVAVTDIVEIEKQESLLMSCTWLKDLASLSDPLCRLIGNAFLDRGRLLNIIRLSCFLERNVVMKLCGLFLSLMADSKFKSQFAVEYSKAFLGLCIPYGTGIGLQEANLFSLSVQFLNRHHNVQEMVGNYSFYDTCVEALTQVLSRSASLVDGNMQGDVCCEFRRYNPILADLRVIFTIPSTNRRFISEVLHKFLNLLETFSGMHPQTREIRGHVEYETKEWLVCFNLYLGIGGMFEGINNWIQAADAHESALDGETNLLPASTFFDILLTKLLSWVESRARTVIKSNCSIRVEEHVWVAFLRPFQDDHRLDPRPTHSFHLFLHRFFASALIEALKNPNLTEFSNNMQVVLQADQNGLRTDNGTTDDDDDDLVLVHPLLIDHPLSCIAISSEIRTGLWVRNGVAMKDQGMNYSEQPYSRIFKDLDMIWVQYFAARSLNLSNILPFIPRVFNAFGILDYLQNRKFEGRIYHYYDQDEADKCVLLFEECLLFVITMVSDLPEPPTWDKVSRIEEAMRRELVHKLCSGPFTFSQLVEMTYIVPGHAAVAMTDIEKLIHEVAESGGTPSLKSMEAPKLTLRSALWIEYDPAYPGLSLRQHQDIIEMRPKVEEVDTPLVVAPTIPHPCFKGLREFIFSDPTLLKALRLNAFSLLVQASRQSSSGSASHLSKYTNIGSLHNCSDTLWFRTLHILTLNAHNLISCEVETTTPFIRFLLELVPVRTMGNAELDEEVEKEKKVENEDQFNFLSALIDIHELPASNKSDANNKVWLGWVLTKFGQLSSETHQLLSMRAASRESEERVKLLEDRKRMARERSLQLMRNRAASFAATMEIDDEERKECEENGTLENRDNSEVDDLELATCIICHDSTDSNRRLGLQVFSQTSFVCSNDSPRDTNAFVVRSPNEHPTRQPFGVYVSSCQHSLHFDCFYAYFARVVDRNDQGNGTILDTSKGQFLCPCCKRLANCLVPYYPARRSRQRKRPRDLGCMATDSCVNTNAEPTCTHRLIDSMMKLTPQQTENYESQGKGNQTELCWQFLSGITSPVCTDALQFSIAGNSFAFLKRIEVACKAVHYSVRCSMLNQLGSNFYLARTLEDNKGSPRLNELECLSSIMGSIGSTLDEAGLKKQVFDSLVAAFTFPITGEKFCDSLDTSVFIEQHSGEMEKNDWIHSFLLKVHKGILSLPLLDVLTLTLCNMFGSPENTSSDCESATVRLIAIAALVQIYASVVCCPPGQVRTLHNDVDFVMDENIDERIEPLFALLLESLAPYRLQDCDNAKNHRLILAYFCSYLRVAVQLVNRSGLSGIIEREVVLAHSATSEVSECQRASSLFAVFKLEPFLLTPEGHLTVFDMAKTWILASNDPSRNMTTKLTRRGSEPYDFPEIHACNKLVSMPKSYAQLHASVKSLAPSLSDPAICLVCGSILDGGGSGSITAHVKGCSGDAGLAFLLQQSMVLMLHGDRCAYAPSPYVDDHGERQKSVRGRPLFCDERMFKCIETMWIDHEIPREIASKRSSLSHIIRLNYY